MEIRRKNWIVIYRSHVAFGRFDPAIFFAWGRSEIPEFDMVFWDHEFAIRFLHPIRQLGRWLMRAGCWLQERT